MGDAPGFQLGPYLLTHKVAAGGMGEVFIGLHANKGPEQQPVAVKVLLAHLSSDDEAVGRFLSEAQLASRMHHPHVVRILDVGEHEGRHWLAMELVVGVSLSRLLAAAKAKGEPLPIEVLAFVGRALCDGLAHAHALTAADGTPLDLVHRDVTPHNVLVSGSGEVKLSDFGIARVRDSHEHTRPGVLHGKLEYLSPEQLDGKGADRRTDVYAAGVTLFVLAAGTDPFVRPTPQATARAIRTEAPADLAALRPDLPAAYVEAVRRAMSRNPESRFPTALSFRDALPAVAAGADHRLGALVRALCPDDVATLSAAIEDARALAPQTEGLVVPPTSRDSVPRPRGTIEVESPTFSRRPLWPWALGAGLAALGAALWARCM